MPLDHATLPDKRLVDAREAAWDRALALGEKHGFRNAQATVVAPTGTIGLVMDCDTTGIEPDFALVKFKKLAGGGYFKIINQSVPEALRGSATRRTRSPRSKPTPSATARCASRPPSTTRRLKAKGFTDEVLARSKAALAPRSTSSSCSTAGRSATTSSPTR